MWDIYSIILHTEYINDNGVYSEILAVHTSCASRQCSHYNLNLTHSSCLQTYYFCNFDFRFLFDFYTSSLFCLWNLAVFYAVYLYIFFDFSWVNYQFFGSQLEDHHVYTKFRGLRPKRGGYCHTTEIISYFYLDEHPCTLAINVTFTPVLLFSRSRSYHWTGTLLPLFSCSLVPLTTLVTPPNPPESSTKAGHTQLQSSPSEPQSPLEQPWDAHCHGTTDQRQGQRGSLRLS